MGIRLFTEKDRERWDEYAGRSTVAACYHLSGWKDVIEKSFGHSAYYLLSESSEGLINGILPLIHLKSRLFGSFMISLPYFNYGGICADSDEIENRLLEEAISLADEKRAHHIEFRHAHHLRWALPSKTTKVSMRLGLLQSPGDLWDSFPSKLRNQIRKPSREGMYSRVGREEELDGFYTVFSRNMRDLGTPVCSKDFFRNILNQFPEMTRISTVYSGEGRPAASGFLVGFKDRLEIPWASSLRKYSRSSPNMLLYWSALKFGCENGYRGFDFGRSTPGENTYKFKEQWGAQPVQLYWHYWMRNGEALPELNPKNPKYRTAIALWKRLPVSLTRLIGPSLVKNLP